jgi:hypothetical protein
MFGIVPCQHEFAVDSYLVGMQNSRSLAAFPAGGKT